MQELHSQVMRLIDEVEGPNGIMKRINSANWFDDGSANSTNSRLIKPSTDDASILKRSIYEKMIL